MESKLIQDEIEHHKWVNNSAVPPLTHHFLKMQPGLKHLIQLIGLPNYDTILLEKDFV
jgi:hypothetical protein